MSKYTTELRFICENYAGYDENQGYSKIGDIIESARTKVFDFDFPMYDEAYRSVLETKIIKHYYTREIGAETVGLWKHFLDRKMNEIMPYYNQLYESALIKFNPLYDVDVTKEHEGKDTGNVVGNTVRDNTNSGERWDYYSETPQGGINGLQTLDYLTTADRITHNDKDNTKTDSTTNMSNTDEYIDHIYGKQGVGSYSKYLKEFRETFLNIDMMIIDDLADLFMNLW